MLILANFQVIDTINLKLWIIKVDKLDSNVEGPFLQTWLN